MSPGQDAVETLPVAEVFGPTFQGEGRSLGRLAAFIRLGGCNLTCASCDTPYTWDGRRFDLREELRPMSVAQIVGLLPAAPLVVLTGGEPMLYQVRAVFTDLLHALWRRGVAVEIETNGTLAPGQHVVDQPHVSWNVSPKLAGAMSDDAEDRRIVPAVLGAFAGLAAAGRAVFKFVVGQSADLDQVDGLVAEHALDPTTVWIMPEGVTPERILSVSRTVADEVLARGYNMTTRLHVLLWPGDRGR